MKFECPHGWFYLDEHPFNPDVLLDGCDVSRYGIVVYDKETVIKDPCLAHIYGKFEPEPFKKVSHGK